jgi:hypothetical protein
MKKLIILAVLLAIAYVLTLDDASAEDYSLQNWCIDQGQSWNISTGTCTVGIGSLATVASGDKLTIAAGEILLVDYDDYTDNFGAVESYGTIDNFGNIENDGIIMNREGTIYNSTGGVINNSNGLSNFDLIINAAGATFYNEHHFLNFSEFNNESVFINYHRFDNHRDGSIYNTGFLTNYCDLIFDPKCGELFNLGIIENEYSFINDGSVENQWTGTITNRPTGFIISTGFISNLCSDTNPTVCGQINNQGTFNLETWNPFGLHTSIYNYGYLDNTGNIILTNGIFENRGTFTNHDSITNDGSISNMGTLTNESTIDNKEGIINSGTFSNEGNIENEGSIVNSFYGVITNNSSATITNLESGSVVNYSTLENYGTILNHDYFENFGVVENHGTINNYFGAIIENRSISINSEPSPALILNYGMIDNWGDIDNDGTIDNHGTINNHNTFNNLTLATINNFSTTTINNFGTINNEGTINNPGTINNSGTIDNSGTIINYSGGSITGNDVTGDGAVNDVEFISVDIKPGSDPNCFNNNDNGVIPVAVLTTDIFDAANVDPLSITLNGMQARVKGKSGNAGAFEDVDADGDLDLVVQIVDTDGTFDVGDTIATLSVFTYDGIELEGSDSICIVPK